MPTPANARISRVGGSWRVRLFGYDPEYFADSKYGGQQAALAAARKWRDARWDGTTRYVKLSKKKKAEIRRSKEHYVTVAEREGITPNYVHAIRRGDA